MKNEMKEILREHLKRLRQAALECEIEQLGTITDVLLQTIDALLVLEASDE